MSDTSWERRLYRGNKVFVKVDPEGRPVAEREGLAAIRYHVDDPREYHARIRDLQELTPEVVARLEQEKARRRRRSAWIRVFVAGGAEPNPGPAGVGVVLEADGYRREVAVFLGKATHNVAELRAVEEALDRIRDRTRKVRLHVGSAYLEGVLTGSWKAGSTRPLIERIRQDLAEFSRLKVRRIRFDVLEENHVRAAELATRAREEQRDFDELVET